MIRFAAETPVSWVTSMFAHADIAALVAANEADFPLEVIAIGLVGIATRVLHRPLAHVPMLKAGDLPLQGRSPCLVSEPQTVIQREVLVLDVPPASRTLLAVCEFAVFFVE